MKNRLPSYIKPKGVWWKIIPYASYAGTTLYPYIYLPKAFCDNLQSKKPNEYYLALVEHEKVHLRRQQEMGILPFCFKYLFYPSFRLEEEIQAYKVQKVYLQTRNLSFDKDSIAKKLSSLMYLYCTSYTKAQEML